MNNCSVEHRRKTPGDLDRRRFALWGLALSTAGVAAAAAGCRPASTTISQPAASGLSVTDRLGREVSLASPPQRIISTSPAATELLFALGLGDRVVAVSQYCDWPPEARNRPQVGAASAQSISIESIVALKPELVLCLADAHLAVIESLDRLGVTALAIGPQSLAQLYEEARWLGQLTHSEAQVQLFVRQMQQEIQAAQRQVPERSRPLRVFYEVWDEPLMSVAAGSYIDELLQIAGLQNVVADVDMAYPQVSHEAIIAADPEVILAPGTGDIDYARWSTRAGWQGVSAVRHQRIHLLNGDWISRCGPRLPMALQQIVNVVYRPPSSEPSSSQSLGRDEAAA